MKAFMADQMLSEAFVAQLESSGSGTPRHSYQRRIQHTSVEWNFIETSTEDGLLARAAVNRNDYTSHRYSDSNNVRATMASTERSCSSSIDFETFQHEDDAARIKDCLEDGSSEAENNQASEQKDPHETETNLLEDRDWQAFIQDMKLRRRCSEFPPPLASLSGKCFCRLHHRPACVQLQRIRSKGRFVLQEVKTPPVLSFQPIRSQGRLVLQLIHRNGEDVPVPRTEKLSVPTSQMISGADSKVIIPNHKFMSSQSEQSSDDISNGQQATMTDNLISADDLDKKYLLPLNPSNKKEARESKNYDNMHHLLSINTTNNTKEPFKACSDIDDDKYLSENECSNKENHRKNSCRIPEELFQISEFNFKRETIRSADLPHVNSSETTYGLDHHLPKKAAPSNIGATPHEKGVELSNSTHSLLQLSVFKMRNVIRGVDSASSFGCKRCDKREEDYIPKWKSRCVASS